MNPEPAVRCIRERWPDGEGTRRDALAKDDDVPGQNGRAFFHSMS